MRTAADTTGAIGVAVVELIVNRDLGWILRRQDQADHGIDAQLEIVDDDGTVTGRLLALQIKAGPHYFKRRQGNTIVAHVSARHLDYWAGHSLPVLLVLVDVETQVAYWHLVQEPIERTAFGGNLYVPERNRLAADAKLELRSFTQTPAELRAERDVARREAARLAALLEPTPRIETPTAKPTHWEIAEHAYFWESLDAMTDTKEMETAISTIIASIARDPFRTPAVANGVRIVKTRPYLGTPGVRLAYFVSDAAVILLHVAAYTSEDDGG